MILFIIIYWIIYFNENNLFQNVLLLKRINFFIQEEQFKNLFLQDLVYYYDFFNIKLLL